MNRELEARRVRPAATALPRERAMPNPRIGLLANRS